tara:strand:+ start:1811 stop:2107 length:297 start_codon:yes stop_codon:yes gene_type:complete
MKEKELEIGEHKIKITELSWDKQMQLSDAEKFSTRTYMELCIIEPDDKAQLFKELTRYEGTQLLNKINELNKTDEEITDFPQPNQEEEDKKDTKQNTG